LRTAVIAAPIEVTDVLDAYRDFPTGRTGSGLSFVNIQDEFVSWLTFANAGMLSRGNLLCFDYAIRNLPDEGAMVEIGVCAGLSTNLLSYYRRRHGVARAFFNCDAWLFEGVVGETLGASDVRHADYRRFLRDSYLRNVRMFSPGDLPHTVEALSDGFFTAWEGRERRTDLFGREVQLGGPIGFAYIDGDHSYAQSRRDFENVDRHLVPGGFILFDDSADGTKFEVGRLVQEVKGRGDYRVVVKNPNYLVQKVG
jgi:hypothetical protein